MEREEKKMKEGFYFYFWHERSSPYLLDVISDMKRMLVTDERIRDVALSFCFCWCGLSLFSLDSLLFLLVFREKNVP